MKMEKIISILLILLLSISMTLSSCSKPEQAEEGGVKAADPLSEEEQAADDSGGCIEDAEDLLN